MLSIHKAGIGDINLIRTLTMQVWTQTYTPILGETQVKYMLDTMYNEQELQQQMQNGQQYLICYDDGQPVGFASYTQPEEQVYKLNKIYILSQEKPDNGSYMDYGRCSTGNSKPHPGPEKR